jgi:hypothetical protein
MREGPTNRWRLYLYRIQKRQVAAEGENHEGSGYRRNGHGSRRVSQGEIFESDRADGTCKVLSGTNYELVKSIKLEVGQTMRRTMRPATIFTLRAAGVTPDCLIP